MRRLWSNLDPYDVSKHNSLACHIRIPAHLCISNPPQRRMIVEFAFCYLMIGGGMASILPMNTVVEDAVPRRTREFHIF